MRRYLQSIIGLATVLLVSSTLMQKPALAQAAYGSYVGIGGAFGLSEGDDSGRQNGAVIALRYKFLEAPISLRTQAFILGGSAAVVPTVSYDFPLNWQTDVYIGAGYSFANGRDPSPLGDKNGFAIQPGIDYVIPFTNTVIFGNAIFAFDAYRNEGGNAVSIQGGVGLRF